MGGVSYISASSMSVWVMSSNSLKICAPNFQVFCFHTLLLSYDKTWIHVVKVVYSQTPVILGSALQLWVAGKYHSFQDSSS